MKLNPAVSVIMPCYNSEKFIDSAVESILNQSFDDFEFIIVNDGSTDGTRERLSKYSDERISYYDEPHRGLSEQLNYAIDISKGRYIARMDADDISAKDRLMIQYEFLESNSGIDVLGSNYYLIKKGNQYYKVMPEHHTDIEYMMPVLNCLIHPSLFISKKVLTDIGGYKGDLKYSEDHELFLRLLTKGYVFHNIQKPLLKIRVREGSYLQKNLNEHKAQHYKNGKEYLDEKFPDAGSRKSFDYLFRSGLLEYYADNIRSARRYFFNALKSAKGKRIKVMRYLIPALLSERIFLFLRKNKILSGAHFMLLKYSKTDTHTIRKN